MFFYPEGGTGVNFFYDPRGEFSLGGEGVMENSIEMFFERFVFVVDGFH